MYVILLVTKDGRPSYAILPAPAQDPGFNWTSKLDEASIFLSVSSAIFALTKRARRYEHTENQHFELVEVREQSKRSIVRVL